MSYLRIKDVMHDCYIWVSNHYEQAKQSRKVMASTQGSWLQWFNLNLEQAQKRLRLSIITNPNNPEYVLINDPTHNTYLWVSDCYEQNKQSRQVLASTFQSWMQYYQNDIQKVRNRLSFKIESYQDNFVLIQDKTHGNYLWVADSQTQHASRLLKASTKESWMAWYPDNPQKGIIRLLMQIQ